MKVSRVFPRQIIFSLLMFILFAVNLLAQEVKSNDETRPIKYITSKKDVEPTRPRVIKVKRTAIERVPAKEAVEIKPNDYSLEKKAFQLINAKRTEIGLEELVWNEKMAELARQHSQNMAKYSFFSHVGLNGRTIDQRALDFGLRKWKAIGENIAYNKGFENPAEFAVERWMLSPTHRQNLLDKRWQESGIGIGITDDGCYFFTQVFVINE